jgi:hypothetical protein
MRSLVIFNGLKRSGNHAVLNWIKSSNKFKFLNNVLPFKSLLRAGLIYSDATYPLPTYLGRKRLLISIEDMPVSRPLFHNTPPNTSFIVLVRDPVNLFASRIRKGSVIAHPAYPLTMDDVMKRAIKLWKEHARLCLATIEPSTTTLGIFFDRWVVDGEYRRRIADWLKIAPDDTTLKMIAKTGGGSSFQSLSGDSNAASSIKDVLNRAELLQPHEGELLSEILRDDEILSLRSSLLSPEGPLA